MSGYSEPTRHPPLPRKREIQTQDAAGGTFYDSSKANEIGNPWTSGGEANYYFSDRNRAKRITSERGGARPGMGGRAGNGCTLGKNMMDLSPPRFWSGGPIAPSRREKGRRGINYRKTDHQSDVVNRLRSGGGGERKSRVAQTAVLRRP